MIEKREKNQKHYKYHQISETIIDKIATGEWVVGEKIPPEAELCELLDVSRVTLRESLKTLAILGILDIVQGDGTYVKEINPAGFIAPLLPLLRCNHTYIDEIYQARMIVEGGCSSLAARNRTQDDIDELQGLIEDMQDAVELGSYSLFNEADTKFHQIIIRCCGNDLLSAVGNMFSTLVTYYIGEINVDPATIISSLSDHKKIYEAIRDQRADFARIMMSEHLRCSMLVLKKRRQQD